MSPWELGAIYVLLPVLAFMAWILERTDTDGAPVPEFETWCRAERPTLVALSCSPGQSERVAQSLSQALGARLEVEHHRGCYPWTRYLFGLEIERDEQRDVVRVRVKTCAMRRLKETRPEIGAVVDQLVESFVDSIGAFWVHADLRHEDEERDAGRRERGWIATIERGSLGAFAKTKGLPGWVREARE